MSNSAHSTGQVKQREPLRKLSVGLLLVECLALVAAAIYSALSLPVVDPRLGTFALGLAAFLGLFAILVALAAKSLWSFGRFGVSFGVTWQMFQALVGSAMLRGGLYIPGIFALGLAIALFVMLLKRANRPEREFLVGTDA